MMKVSEIWVYPIKGLGGIKLESSNALLSGLEMDRRMMLIDEKDTFISQRSHPTLATLGASLINDEIRIYSKIDPSINIQFKPELQGSHKVIANVWKSKVSSLIYPNFINEWFSDFLGDKIRLVSQEGKSSRQRTLPFSPRKIDMSYADGYPYLILSEASVEQLNSEIEHHVDIRQFRPNIILNDCDAFAEDELGGFLIGEAQFRMVKPCVRCPVINIDQDTGKSNKATTLHLSKTRRQGNGIIFGMNAAILANSVINIGDRIK